MFPGDQLHLHVDYERHKLGMWKAAAKAMVDGKVMAEGILTASIVARKADERDHPSLGGGRSRRPASGLT